MTTVPTFKAEISIGHIATWLGLMITIVGIGMAIGQDRTEIQQLKAAQTQFSQDSRALIRMQSDLDYLKRAVDEIRNKP